MSDAERFWAKVDKSGGMNACWPWTGSKKRGGRSLPYGYLVAHAADGSKRVRTAHRVSWEMAHGPIPERYHVLHCCDNASCVNTSHLFIGTHADNMRDRSAKGRQARGSKTRPKNPARGERHGNAKLTADDARAIRRAMHGGASRADVARKFGTSPQNVALIANGKAWAHV